MKNGRVPLDAALATPDSKGRYVRRLFSTIADRYDLITVLLSFGLDRRWKRRALRLAEPKPGQRALDLACGTGDLVFGLAAHGTHVVGVDITHRMLVLARLRAETAIASARQARTPTVCPEQPAPRPHPARPTPACAEVTAGKPHPVFVQGDMIELPFADAQFELVTTGYGLRNVPDLAAALREIRRVLRPGGVFVSLDFNRPSNVLVRSVYLGYLWLVGGALGWALHRDADTYRYVPASIERYPGAEGVVALLKSQGFLDAEWRRVLAGLMAIHVARR